MLLTAAPPPLHWFQTMWVAAKLTSNIRHFLFSYHRTPNAVMDIAPDPEDIATLSLSPRKMELGEDYQFRRKPLPRISNLVYFDLQKQKKHFFCLFNKMLSCHFSMFILREKGSERGKRMKEEEMMEGEVRASKKFFFSRFCFTWGKPQLGASLQEAKVSSGHTTGPFRG